MTLGKRAIMLDSAMSTASYIDVAPASIFSGLSRTESNFRLVEMQLKTTGDHSTSNRLIRTFEIATVVAAKLQVVCENIQRGTHA
jgi:hypothetical protein